ncbi:MAG TPA: FAD-dependent monooxygenase [Vicinamibacterales bacterium]|nr:FAD-dependent monooxygenase [Vicinamibacterales bacterium]
MAQGTPPKAIVIGAGVGGLAAGIALRLAGCEVEVYERAGELHEVGAGISLWANAIGALERLGLGDAVRSASVPYEVAGIRTPDGRFLATVSSELLEREFGTPIIVVHRADLQAALLGRLGPERLHPGRVCTGFEQTGDAVTAIFDDGRRARADLLIGADGLHSVIRAQIHGRQPPRYAGCTAWRAVVRFSDRQVRASESWGRGSVFGQVPMSGGRVYWYATRNEPAGGRSAHPRSELFEMFRGWHDPIGSLIEAADEPAILRNDIYDRDPARRWGTGRVTLVGDAAHPMTPFMGQGGCQALEDAVVLGHCLERAGDVPASLRAYERIRIRRANTFVTRSRMAGRIAQLQHPVAVKLRNAVFARLSPHLQTAQLAKLIRGAGPT